jgi:hypothetical protein
MQAISSDKLVNRAQRNAGLITLLACAIALGWGWRVVGGVAAGAVCGMAGFYFLRRFVPWLLARRQPKTWLWIAWGLKVPVILAFLYLAIFPLAVSPVGLCIGVSIMPLAIISASIYNR